MQTSNISWRKRLAVSAGITAIAAVLFSALAFATPSDTEKLTQIDKDIEKEWSAKSYPKAKQLFTEWFTLAEKVQKEEPGNPALAEWATDMRKWSDQLYLESDYHKLDTLAQSISESWNKGQYEIGKKEFEEWTTLAESVKQRDSKNPEITIWITEMAATEEAFTLEEDWKKLEKKDMEMSKAWNQGDFSAAKKLMDEWFTLSEKMRETADLLKWKADMKNSRSQLENEIVIDALWRQLEAKDKESAAAWDKGNLDRSKSFFTEFFASAEALRKLLSPQERESLLKWTEDMRGWEKQLDVEFTVSNKWKALESTNQDLSKAWGLGEYRKTLALFEQWFTTAEDLKKLLPADQKPDLEKWIVDMKNSKKELEDEIKSSETN